MADAYESTFKGKKIINLPFKVKDKEHVCRFGITKARAIVEHFDAIKAFVAKYQGGDDGEE